MAVLKGYQNLVCKNKAVIGSSHFENSLEKQFQEIPIKKLRFYIKIEGPLPAPQFIFSIAY